MTDQSVIIIKLALGKKKGLEIFFLWKEVVCNEMFLSCFLPSLELSNYLQLLMIQLGMFSHFLVLVCYITCRTKLLSFFVLFIVCSVTCCMKQFKIRHERRELMALDQVHMQQSSFANFLFVLHAGKVSLSGNDRCLRFAY